jgi:hypothetical protein
MNHGNFDISNNITLVLTVLSLYLHLTHCLPYSVSELRCHFFGYVSPDFNVKHPSVPLYPFSLVLFRTLITDILT